jgi:excisionase family DNA binding protein
MTEPLLTTRHVADLLGVSPETILRWVGRGLLPAFRLPSGALRFRQSDLDAWLAERATPGQGVLTTMPDAAHRAPYPLGSMVLTTIDDKE